MSTFGTQLYHAWPPQISKSIANHQSLPSDLPRSTDLLTARSSPTDRTGSVGE